MSPKIRCIAFDLDGVVIPSGPSFEYFERVHQISRADFRQFFGGAYEQAMLGKADLYHVLPPALKQWKWSGTVQEFAQTWFESCAEPDPSAIELIRNLRALGITCYAASNQDARRARFLDSLGWLTDLFDRRFYSCHVGVKKPSGEYFEVIRREAGLPGKAMLFIDDNLDNVEGARQCGWFAEVCTDASNLRAIVSGYLGQPGSVQSNAAQG